MLVRVSWGGMLVRVSWSGMLVRVPWGGMLVRVFFFFFFFFLGTWSVTNSSPSFAWLNSAHSGHSGI